MKKIFFVILILPFFAFSQSNDDISNSQWYDGEPFLAVNPTNHNNMVVAWIGISSYRVSINVLSSFDGGQTWGNAYAMPHMGITWGSADPTMCFKSDGSLYMGYIDYTKTPTPAGAVYVSKSTDGGINWSTPVEAINISEDAAKDPVDRPWLVVDNSSASTHGFLYLVSKPAPWIPAPNRPYFKRSIDDGQTWSTLKYVDSTGYLVGNVIPQPMPTPEVNAAGKLFIAYPSYLASQSLYARMLLASSTNGGDGFLYSSMFNVTASVTDTNLKLGYHLAVHPSDQNKMAFVSVYGLLGDTDIYLSSTNNAGLTWSAPVRVNDDAQGNGVLQDMPWCSYADNGDLLVTWRDRRNAGGTGFYQPNDFYAAVSNDNGITFNQNIRISSSTAQFDSILSQSGNDFMGCDLHNDTIYAAWGDTRSGELEIYFSRTPVNNPSGIISSVISSEKIFEIFPNPSKDQLNLLLKYLPENSYVVDIRDMKGNMIKSFSYQRSLQNIKLEISDLAAGSYMICIMDGTREFGVKFLKK